jgi:hypothetical protein
MERTASGNIGRLGQRRRRRAGVVSLVLAVIVFAVLAMNGMGRWWHLALFPFLWVGALGFIQARARTCVALAARGTCELDDGSAAPLDEATAARMKVQARGVMVRSTVLAAAVTALAVWVG